MRADSKRRTLLGAASALALAPLAIGAKDPGPKRIIWALYLGTEEGRKRFGDPRDRIRSSLKSRGHLEGRDFTITFVQLPPHRKPESDEFADRLIRSEPDVIAMFAHLTLWSLRSRTRSIPVVFYDVGEDPAKMGLVESLRRPETNFTGAFLGMGDFLLKSWELLKELVPSMTRGGTLVSKETLEDNIGLAAPIGNLDSWKELREEGKRVAKAQLAIEVVDVVVPSSASAGEVEAALRKSRVQAVEVASFSAREAETFRAATSRFPTAGLGFASAKAGMLIGIGWDRQEGESYAIEAVGRILRGDDPATIPVYKNKELGIAFNRATARRLGIEIPPSLLMRANEVYE